MKAGRRGVTFAIAGSLAAMVFAVVAIAASLPGSNFEIDDNANLVVDTAGMDDWKSIPQGTTPGTEIRKPDSPSGSNDESFGNGTRRTPRSRASSTAASRRTRAT